MTPIAYELASDTYYGLGVVTKRVCKYFHLLTLVQGLIPNIWPHGVLMHSFLLSLNSVLNVLELLDNSLVLFFGPTTGCTGGHLFLSFICFYLLFQSLDSLALCHNVTRMGLRI